MPREQHFTPQRRLPEAARTLAAHLHNPVLRLTCAVGFLILFVLVSVFNTVTLRLAAPPYSLGSGRIGLIFAVYLLGAVITPVTAPALARRGARWALGAAVLTSLAGLALTLALPLPLVIAGAGGGGLRGLSGPGGGPQRRAAERHQRAQPRQRPV